MSMKKKIYVVVMTLVLCIMTLGYAALQERIDVEVRADIDSTYRVEITSVQEGTIVGDARSVSAASYHDLSSTFNVGLTNETDYITYTIEVTNYSTVDVILNNTEITTTNNNFKISKIGISNGDIILAGSTKTFTVKIKLDTETGSEQTSTITINLDFTRLKGGTGEVAEEVYEDYEIGDVISFAGSNWYVIEDSADDKDYVTVLKQTLLTGTEIGANYVKDGNTSNNTMAYYWSSTCHSARTYGTDVYSSGDSSGCSGHSGYDGSKVREMLEGTYLLSLGFSNLKEVDGYKIRILNRDDLINNLGWKSGMRTQATTSGNDVPLWVYGVYWTMQSYNEFSVFFVQRNYINSSGVNYNGYGVRPVINLYKSAID